jgi:molybdopterin adenylyltransferase
VGNIKGRIFLVNACLHPQPDPLSNSPPLQKRKTRMGVKRYGIMKAAEVAMYGLAILTVSTSSYHGQREDTSGQAIKEVLAPPDYEVVRYEIVSDEKDMIAERMAQWADSPEVDLIVSTGGTGLGPRDVTPEACLSIIDREVPGIAETMRAETLKFTPMAMLSRSVAGIRGNTLIITLPGSPKGVRETLEIVRPVLPHALELLKKESVSEHPR